MNLTYTVSRYEQLKPDIFLVAFNITDENDNSAYIESELASAEISGKNANEICQLAYEKIKDQIASIKQDFAAKFNLKIGYQFTPQINE